MEAARLQLSKVAAIKKYLWNEVWAVLQYLKSYLLLTLGSIVLILKC